MGQHNRLRQSHGWRKWGWIAFHPENWPPVLIPFFTFRIMVGCGLLMLLLAWVGSYLNVKGRIEQNRLLLWAIFLSFPLPFIAILTGWFTAEVGRQPWTVYGVLRTANSLTPFLTARDSNDLAHCLLHSLHLHFRVRHFLHLSTVTLRTRGSLARAPAAAVPNRPMSVVDGPMLSVGLTLK